jgi:hypothetical protein
MKKINPLIILSLTLGLLIQTASANLLPIFYPLPSSNSPLVVTFPDNSNPPVSIPTGDDLVIRIPSQNNNIVVTIPSSPNVVISFPGQNNPPISIPGGTGLIVTIPENTAGLTVSIPTGENLTVTIPDSHGLVISFPNNNRPPVVLPNGNHTVISFPRSVPTTINFPSFTKGLEVSFPKTPTRRKILIPAAKKKGMVMSIHAIPNTVPRPIIRSF